MARAAGASWLYGPIRSLTVQGRPHVRLVTKVQVVTGSTASGATMVDVLLTELASVSRAVSQTSARLAKVAALADALRSASAEEIPIVVAYLSGELPQRQIGVGWAALRSVPAAAEASSLTVLAVDDAFSRIGAVSGKGSAATRKRLVGELFGVATAEEQYFL